MNGSGVVYLNGHSGITGDLPDVRSLTRHGDFA